MICFGNILSDNLRRPLLFVIQFFFADQTEKLYTPVAPNLCGLTCDQKAICSCGTISGVYQCACRPGYYGSGTPGRCHSKHLYVYIYIYMI